MDDPRAPLVVDANVLIDYANTDVSILTLVAGHLAKVHVPMPVLEKVDQLDATECARVGLVVVLPAIEQILEAGACRGGLAFDDRVCLILARDHRWTCMTNDRALRRACREAGIPAVWGLAPMLDLVRGGALDAVAAAEVARRIHHSNPRFVTTEIVDTFERKLRSLTEERT